jgi:hypothetical protein
MYAFACGFTCEFTRENSCNLPNPSHQEPPVPAEGDSGGGGGSEDTESDKEDPPLEKQAEEEAEEAEEEEEEEEADQSQQVCVLLSAQPTLRYASTTIVHLCAPDLTSVDLFARRLGPGSSRRQVRMNSLKSREGSRRRLQEGF